MDRKRDVLRKWEWEEKVRRIKDGRQAELKRDRDRDRDRESRKIRGSL